MGGIVAGCYCLGVWLTRATSDETVVPHPDRLATKGHELCPEQLLTGEPEPHVLANSR